MDLIARTIDWHRRRRREPRARYRTVVHVTNRAALPSELSRRTVYTIGDEANPKRALFMCPCGHTHHIDLPLTQNPREQRAWQLCNGPQGVTLKPSIDIINNERRCHFWLEHSKVAWARD